MNEKNQSENKVILPLFEEVRKAKYYQDFCISDVIDFRYGFVIPTRDGDGNLKEDIWCITPQGFIWSEKLTPRGAKFVFDTNTIDKQILDIFLPFSGVDFKDPKQSFHLFCDLYCAIKDKIVDLELEGKNQEEGILMKQDFVQNFFKLMDFYTTKLEDDDFSMSIKEVSRTIFEVIKKTIDFYCDYKDEQEIATTLFALYLMGTWVYEIFDSYCYLLFVGERRSGKTKNLKLAKQIAWNVIASGSISPPSLYRLVELLQPTLTIDETDEIAKEKGLLRQLLLTGAEKGFPAFRTEEKGVKKRVFVPYSFETYCPKIMAGIKGFDDVLEDRCLKFIMVRSRGEKSSREPENDVFFRRYLRPILLCWGISFFYHIYDTYKNLEINSEILNPRERKYYKPILALAMVCGEDLYKQVLSYLEIKSKERYLEEEEDDPYISLIKILVWRWHNWNNDYEVTPAEISHYLESLGVAINAKTIANMLKKLKFIERRPVGGRWRYTIRKKKLESLLSDYNLKWDAIIEEFQEEEKKIEEPQPEEATDRIGRAVKVLKTLSPLFGNKIPKNDLIESFKRELFMDEVKAIELIEKLLRDGIIFMPKEGIYSLV